MIIKVPATSANMGPGFDCMGLALSMYNTSHIQLSDQLVLPVIPGINEEDPKSHLTYQAMLRLWQKIGKPPRNITMQCHNEIPMTRGLGSSSACIVTGLLAANHLEGDPVDIDGIIDLAADMEGHPDNVLPAICGGITVGVLENKHVLYSRIAPPSNIQCIVWIPGQELSTKTARGVLPEQYSREDVVFNISRAALLAACLASGQTHCLDLATRDRIHQPYRQSLIAGWDQLESRVRQAGAIAVYLSGAGPTMMSIWPCNAAAKDLAHLSDGIPGNWKMLALSFDPEGAVIADDLSLEEWDESDI